MTEILSALLAESRPDSRLAAGLVSMCARSLPVSGAGLGLMTHAGHAGTVAATDRTASALEEMQFTLGEGPCVDASRSGRPVLVPDLARNAQHRWPAFAEAAHAAGLRAVFALPLRVGGVRVGVLDLYRDSVGVLPSEQLADALSFADAATMLLLHLQAQDAGVPLDSLVELDDRAEVHQATGVVSVHAGVGLEQALVLLRARAYAEQRPVGELARDVLSGVVSYRQDLGGSPEPDGR